MNTVTTQIPFVLQAAGYPARDGRTVSVHTGTVTRSGGALTGFIVEVGRMGKTPFITGVVAILSTLISGILNLLLLIR